MILILMTTMPSLIYTKQINISVEIMNSHSYDERLFFHAGKLQ